MDSRAVSVENQENNAPVATQPYNAPVGDEEMQTAQSVTGDNEAYNYQANNAPVVIQAGLGRLICEHCGANVERKTFNQRFCSTQCRMAYHGYRPPRRAGV